eukprot:1178148-Prorocentrum_minimum.AAC.1
MQVLALLGKEIRVRLGEKLVEEGHSSNYFYFVLEGEVKLLRNNIVLKVTHTPDDAIVRGSARCAGEYSPLRAPIGGRPGVVCGGGGALQRREERAGGRASQVHNHRLRCLRSGEYRNNKTRRITNDTSTSRNTGWGTKRLPLGLDTRHSMVSVKSWWEN